jgi:hypothetical protein
MDTIHTKRDARFKAAAGLCYQIMGWICAEPMDPADSSLLDTDGSHAGKVRLSKNLNFSLLSYRDLFVGKCTKTHAE